MSRIPKRTLYLLGGAVVLLVAVAASAWLLGDLGRWKPRVESAASDALGMQVRVGGRLRMEFLPSLRVTAEDGRILDQHGVAIATAERVRLRIGWLPLLRGELRVRGIELMRPTLSIERDPQGRWNVEHLRKAAALLGALDGARLLLSEGTLRYADRDSGGAFEAVGVHLVVSRVRLPGDRRAPLPRDISLQAQLGCREIRTRTFAMTDLRASIEGHEGIFQFEPLAIRIFGGQAQGSFRADLSGPIPVCQLRCVLPGFRIEEFLRTLSPRTAAVGAMDFSASLTLRGTSARQWVESAAGELSLRSRHLSLLGSDLDLALSRFDASQRFNLVDVGALFVAGPLGLGVSRGYDFASLFQGAGGRSTIEVLVSDWTVERGVAKAQDVALATSRNRIALQGELDFVHQRFADVTMAAIDPGGCARLRQEIHGPFANPVVEKPRLLTSLAGPVLHLYQRARGVFPERPCEVFYSGSVAPPG